MFTKFEEYANKYQCVRMERCDGILQMTLHTNGDTLQWGDLPHGELPGAFGDIARDPDNKVVIMTGAGDAFTGPKPSSGSMPVRTVRGWDKTRVEGRYLWSNLLEIPVPMISAINGPAIRHSEIPLLCNIVLAAEQATFQDSAHFPMGLVPGDGMHIIYPMLMGQTRGSYFLLTGQTLTAHQALDLGLVNEVLPRDKLLPRAWELA